MLLFFPSLRVVGFAFSLSSSSFESYHQNLSYQKMVSAKVSLCLVFCSIGFTVPGVPVVVLLSSVVR